MQRLLKTGMLICSFALLMSCNKKEGCIDPAAVNYDPDAEKNCCCEYAPPPLPKEFKLDVTKGTTPAQDGLIGIAEWSDAKTVNLYLINGSDPTHIYAKAYVKHDSTALWVAFSVYDSTPGFDDFGDRTVISIDKNYDRNKYPQTDDFFCTLMRSDTSNNKSFQSQGRGTNTGTASDWLTYSPRGAWTAIMANVGTGIGSSWSVEYKIPYSDIGVVTGTAKTIGILLGTTDAFTIWPSWVDDPNGDNWIHPNTWGSFSSSDNWN